MPEHPNPTAAPTPILFVSSHTGLGGGETSLYEMVRCLDPARWTPHLLCPKEGAFTNLWRGEGWSVHILPWRPVTPVFVPALWARLPVVNQIAALIRRERIAAVRPEFHSVPLAAPACRKAGIPWVWMVHGQWTHPYRWQRGLFRQAAHLFADSGWTKAGFLGDPPFADPDRVEVLHLGVDVDRFVPGVDGGPVREALGIAPDEQVITILGRFQPIKGHLNFLSMAAQIAPDFPKARFLIVGDNVLDGAIGDRHKAAIIETVNSNPDLKRSVIFTGFTDDLVPTLNATDLLVCASDFESFGMAHLEAMACETPVVSTNNGGPAETVLDGKTGLLVPPKNPDALADAVRQLLSDPERRVQMGKAGRQHVLDTLDVRHYAARFSAVLEAVAER
jgi:glycosyltransferase involved in cell wall biosynthesis